MCATQRGHGPTGRRTAAVQHGELGASGRRSAGARRHRGGGGRAQARGGGGGSAQAGGRMGGMAQAHGGARGDAPLARIPPGPSEPALTLIPSLPSTAGASLLSSSPSPSSSCHQRDHIGPDATVSVFAVLSSRGPALCTVRRRLAYCLPPSRMPCVLASTAPPTLPRLTLGLPPGWYAL